MKLDGNTILITGGSAGIGLAFAKAFLERGNTVIVTGRSEARLAAAREAHPGVQTIRCDAADPDDLAELGARVDADYPALNVLFNNAGIFVNRSLTSRADDLVELTRELDVNVAGAIRTVSVLVDRLTANQGTIINVSSGLAYVPIQSAPIYCATKAALHSYTVSLRYQLAGRVEVIELMPPLVKTDMTTDFHDDASFGAIPVEKLIALTLPKLKAGAKEIRPGRSAALHWMSRIAPGFINGQLSGSSAGYVPGH